MNIAPLRNNIVFQFLDETSGSKGKFQDRKTLSGIIIPVLDSAQKSPRWGVATAVGPDSEVQVGEFIFIEALMWSYGFTFEDEKFWKTDDSKIMFATDDYELTRNTQLV